MKPGPPSHRRATLLRYLAVQVVGTVGLLIVLYVLHLLFDLAWWVIAVVLLLSVTKDVLLYPKLREAYSPHAGRTGREALIGEPAVATTALAPQGYVRVRGEIWRARLPDDGGHAAEGALLVVTGFDGMTLLVAPSGEPAGPGRP